MTRSVQVISVWHRPHVRCGPPYSLDRWDEISGIRFFPSSDFHPKKSYLKPLHPRYEPFYCEFCRPLIAEACYREAGCWMAGGSGVITRYLVSSRAAVSRAAEQQWWQQSMRPAAAPRELLVGNIQAADALHSTHIVCRRIIFIVSIFNGEIFYCRNEFYMITILVECILAEFLVS